MNFSPTTRPTPDLSLMPAHAVNGMANVLYMCVFEPANKRLRGVS